MKAPSRPLILALVGVLLVAGVVAGVVLLKPEIVDSAMLSLSGGTSEVAADDAAPVGQQPAPKAETTESAASGAQGGNGAGGAGAGGTGADSQTGGEANGTGGSNEGASGGTGGTSGGTGGASGGQGGGTSAKGIPVRVLWWHDAKAKPAKGFEIVFASASVKPDTRKPSGTGSIGPCPVGKELTLVVYPDGRSGKRIEVPFTVTKSTEPNSDVDAIHVEVSDDKVRILGNAVKNFDQSFPRF